ncbi:MAG: hypothetical protein LUC93_02280 [Planctomycetaceae bacterium]|nr:hypothetical protein [Planctomycetaceae bacterium]
MRRIVLFAVAVVIGCSVVRGGERAFSWTQAPAKGDYVAVDFNPYHLGKYLAECEVNRPEILNDVKSALSQGEYYRKSTKDQKDRPTRITINVDPEYNLRIVTWRNETCLTCNGTGRKELPFGKFTKNVNTAIRCMDCKGEGYLPNHTTEKYFVLSAEDFADPKLGREIMHGRAYRGAPQGAADYVELLVSKDPEERLDACLWLDENYVRVGMQFQDLMPMLRKARYHEANEKRRLMVWQFWAGKDIPDERKRAFYRIYVNSKNGKVTEKGFYASNR